MLSRNLVFWEVDAQADFMLPGGKLYVPGAEKLLPNIRRLTDAARQGHVFLVSHGCYHTKDDPEFAIFPPHCVKGTPGANLVPEALTERVVTVPNERRLPCPLIFRATSRSCWRSRRSTSSRAGTPTNWWSASVPTSNSSCSAWSRNICVRFAAKGLLERGRRVSVVRDAIETLNSEDGKRAIAELQALGARFITTEQALTLLDAAN